MNTEESDKVDKGNFQAAFQLVYQGTGKREDTLKELLAAFRELNPFLHDKPDEFIKRMINRMSKEIDEQDVTKPKDGFSIF